MNSNKPQDTVMCRDFKYPPGAYAPCRSRRGRWYGLAASLSVLVAIIFLFADGTAEATHGKAPLPDGTAADGRITLSLPLPGGDTVDTAADTASLPEVTAEAEPNWRIETVRSGDSLALIFSRLGLSPQELDRVMRTGGETASLKRLMPGQRLKFAIEDGRLQRLDYEIDRLNTLHAQRQGDDFLTHKTSRELESRITNASAVIDSSLFLAGMEAGLSDNLIMELAGIFGWDIDFALDIRAGDRFTVVYEEKYLDGRKLRDGNILAAEFTNRGETYRALRYTDQQDHADYYSPDGKSMRKAFLRTPVDFTRISSRFGKRFHPTLKKRKNHHGVDYAAPRGTPIRAAGDGKIIFRGRKGGYGKTVIIQHGGKYSTLYAHLSNYNRKLRNGSRVHQGQIIGYVGSTGRSTGPHLHYEFRVDGVHRNPLTVKLPTAAPIQAKFKADFLEKSRGLLSLLDALTPTTVALNTRED